MNDKALPDSTIVAPGFKWCFVFQRQSDRFFLSSFLRQPQRNLDNAKYIIVAISLIVR